MPGLGPGIHELLACAALGRPYLRESASSETNWRWCAWFSANSWVPGPSPGTTVCALRVPRACVSAGPLWPTLALARPDPSLGGVRVEADELAVAQLAAGQAAGPRRKLAGARLGQGRVANAGVAPGAVEVAIELRLAMADQDHRPPPQREAGGGASPPGRGSRIS